MDGLALSSLAPELPHDPGRRPPAAWANRKFWWRPGVLAGCLALTAMVAMDDWKHESHARRAAILEVSCRLPAGTTVTTATLPPPLVAISPRRLTSPTPTLHPAAAEPVYPNSPILRYSIPLWLEDGVRRVTLSPTGPGAAVEIDRLRLCDAFGRTMVQVNRDGFQPASPDAAAPGLEVVLPATGGEKAAGAVRTVRLPLPRGFTDDPPLPVAAIAARSLLLGALLYGIWMLAARVVTEPGPPARYRFLAALRRGTRAIGARRGWAMGLAVGLTLTMAAVSAYNAHPDETNHHEAARFYREHWLPPAVDDPTVKPTLSRYGYSYLQELDPVYALAGKWSAALNPLFEDARRGLDLRLFNVALLAALAWWAARRRSFGAAAALLLISPQVWYVFAYFNADALPLALSMLLAWQLGRAHRAGSGLGRFLREGARRPAGALWLGLLVGTILISKRNYYPVVAFTGAFALWDAWCMVPAGHGGAAERLAWRRQRVVRWAGIATLALGIFAGRFLYDQAIHGFEKPERMAAVVEREAQPGFKPSDQAGANAYWGLHVRDRGIGLGELWQGGRWREESFMSFSGLYGWMTIRGPEDLYGAMKYLYAALVVGGLLALGHAVSRAERGLLLVGVGCMMLTIGVSLVHSWINDFQPQGRYLFPLLPLAAFWAVRHRRAMTHPCLVVLAGTLFALSVYSFVFVGLTEIGR